MKMWQGKVPWDLLFRAVPDSGAAEEGEAEVAVNVQLSSLFFQFDVAAIGFAVVGIEDVSAPPFTAILGVA